MSELLRFLFPFSYFLQSRLKGKKDILFHFWYEWLICVVLLAFIRDWNWLPAIRQFLLGYIAFISIYELGYFANDIYAVRYEENPRLRIKNFNPSNTTITIWVLFRLAVFASVCHYLQLWDNVAWWVYYAALAIVYYLHNTLKNKQLKVTTFFQLAFFRFFAPVFIFFTTDNWLVVLVPVIVNYVLYRTITYMDSKNLLKMPDRPLLSFKISYYLLFLPVMIFYAIMCNSLMPVIIHVYYLFFWLALQMVAGGKGSMQDE